MNVFVTSLQMSQISNIIKVHLDSGAIQVLFGEVSINNPLSVWADSQFITSIETDKIKIAIIVNVIINYF